MITYRNGEMEQRSVIEHIPPTINSNLITVSSNDSIEIAKSIATNIPKYVSEHLDYRHEPLLNIPEEYKSYIWFITPRQVISQISNDNENNPSNINPPFHPKMT